MSVRVCVVFYTGIKPLSSISSFGHMCPACLCAYLLFCNQHRLRVKMYRVWCFVQRYGPSQVACAKNAEINSELADHLSLSEFGALGSTKSQS
jgi:hypothetical protein